MGLGVIVVLAIALVPAWRSYGKSPTAARAAVAGTNVNRGSVQETAYRTPPSSYARPPLTPAFASSLQTTAPRGAAAAKPAQPVTAARTQPKVSIAAARGDCWLEVRAGSAKSKILYVATLAKGKSYSASAPKLWIRFGAPQNVDLALNGKATAIPSATQNVLVTRAGVRAAA